MYDICFLNGKSLLGLPLKERISIYKDVIKPVVGRVQLSQQRVVTSKQQVMQQLNEAIDAREEGVVLKVGIAITHHTYAIRIHMTRQAHA